MTTTPIPTEKPIDRFLPLLKGYRSYSKGYNAHCPSHNDSKKSLMVWEDPTDDHVGVKCFSGCSRQSIVEAVGLTESDLYVKDARKRPASPSITAIDLAVAKLIHPHLLDNLDVIDGKAVYHKDGKDITKKGVVIPYYTADGTPYERYRLRTALKAKEGSFWNEGQAPLIPYGLQKLDMARDAGYLLIGEGETDAWTCWFHNVPFLGVPGAANINSVDGRQLQGIARIYIIREPDQAGEQFSKKLHKRLKETSYAGKVYEIDFMAETGTKDPNDLHQRDMKAFKTALQAAIDHAVPLFPIIKMPQVYDVCDLLEKELPPVAWAIPDIVPEGITLLCGKPKLGKSWMLLAMFVAIAEGGVVLGNVPVEAGKVLYITMEDKERRLKDRVIKLIQGRKVSRNFKAVHEWPRLNEGGIEALEQWMEDHPDTRLIGIDTWAKVKPKSHNRNQSYEEDYDAIAPLQELAAKHHVSIILVHHMKKEECEDPLDMILGSTAIAGAVDGFLLLYRKRGEEDARLFITGRDIEEEQELLITFNQECASWVIKGDSNEFAGTPERQAIIDLLRQHPEGLRAKEISEKTGKNHNTVRNLLVKLRNEEKIILKNNIYCVVSRSHHSQDGQRSQRSQGVTNSPTPVVTDHNSDTPDYTAPLTVVRSDSLANSPIKPLEDTSSNRSDYADYGDYAKFARPGPHDRGNSPWTFEVKEGVSHVTLNKYAKTKRVSTPDGDGWLVWLEKLTTGVVLDGEEGYRTYGMWQVNPVE